MRERGFAILDIANDPLGREITGTAEVRAGVDNQGAASVVMAQVGGAVFVPDDRTDDTVDLVVGVTFEALAPPGAPPVLCACRPERHGGSVAALLTALTRFADRGTFG